MIMWIVLGSLIGVVVIFLIVTTTLDRKKNKKIKLEKDRLNKEVKIAGINVVKEVVAVIKTNEKALSDFIPSVGNRTMKDINQDAKKTLNKIKVSNSYRNLSYVEEQKIAIEKHFEALRIEKSNNWAKRNIQAIDFFVNYKPPINKVKNSQKKSKKWFRKASKINEPTK